MYAQYTVLYIEDEPDNRTLVERFLQFEGFTVYTAKNGQLGLDKAKQIDADGILFNEVWGCRFITPSFRLFRDKVRDELEIPVVGINLHNFGENIGQLDTRIGAFMELIK